MKNKIRFLAMMLIGVLLSVNQVWGAEDILTYDAIGLGYNSSQSGDATYVDFSDVSVTSSAQYAGNIAKFKTSSVSHAGTIQMRTTNSNSGIVTTASGGKATKVVVSWNSETTNGRTIDIYGKNTAYSQASDLYNTSTQGTKLGSIVCGTSTTLNIDGDYAYIGIRSNSNALYLNNITITWGSSVTYTDYLTDCAVMYDVTANLTNVTASPTIPATIEAGGTISTTISANSGYSLPDDITVTGGTKSWNKTTGALSITNVTGDVSITITAVANDEYYYHGDWDDSWDAKKMDVSADGTYWYWHTYKGDGNRQFKITKGSGWDTAYGNGNCDPGFNCSDITNMTSPTSDWNLGGNAAVNYGGPNERYYIILYLPNTVYNSSNDPKICASTSLPETAMSMAAGHKVYFDNSVFGVTPYFRRGRACHNLATNMSLVPGTANLYTVTTTAYDNYVAYAIANKEGWAGDNSIYKVNTGDDHAITKSTNYIKETIDGDITIVPSTTSGTDQGCTYYNYNKTAGMLTHTATITTPSNGTITVAYTDVDNTSKNFTSGNRDLAHTCNLTITATPNTGYQLTSLTVNGNAFTSGSVHKLSADATIAATFSVAQYSLSVASVEDVVITATPQDGSAIAEGGNANVDYNKTVTLNYSNLTPGKGLTWDVYKTGESGTKVTVNNNTFTMPAYPVTVAATIADLPTWTITLNSGSGTLSSGTTEIVVVQGQSTTLPSCEIDCEDSYGEWQFAGWKTGSNVGTITTTTPTFVPTEYTPSGNITLYAVYQAVDASGGSEDVENKVGMLGNVISGTWSGTGNYSAMGGKYCTNTAPDGATKIKSIYVLERSNWTSGAKLTITNNTKSTTVGTIIGGTGTIYPNVAVSPGDAIRFTGESGKTVNFSGITVTYVVTSSITRYWSIPCNEKYTMTFHGVGGDASTINWTELDPDNYVELPATTITAYPTCATAETGWTFLGWRTTDYNSGKEVDDENASTDDPGVASIYKNGRGYALNSGTTEPCGDGVRCVDMYPVFTKFVENDKPEIANLASGSKYYMYYTSDAAGYQDDYSSLDGRTTRIYAHEFSSASFNSTTACASAQLFEFTKRADGNWDIRMRNAADNGYESHSYIYTVADNTDLYTQAAQPDHGWVIETVTIGGNTMVKMQYAGNTNTSRFMKVLDGGGSSASGTFKNYSEDCEETTMYHPIYLGSCSNRIFSSNPGHAATWEVYGDFTDDETANFVGYPMTNGMLVVPNLAANTTYPFKLRKTTDNGANYTWFGAADEDNTYTTSGTEWTLNGSYNVNLVTGAAGSYTFIASHMSAEYPGITVTYPTAYTITFDGNGNDGGSMTNVTNIAAGENVTLAANAYTKTNNAFVGWDTNSAGTNVVYGDQATINNVSADITLYAVWVSARYTITLDANGGEVSPDRVQQAVVGGTVALPTPTRDGYAFDGWYTEREGGNKITEAYPIPLADATYYAHWTSLATSWYVKGTFDWINGVQFVKMPGQSSDVAFAIVEWNSDDNMNFKIYDSAEDKWYGNEGTMTRTNCTGWNVWNDNNNETKLTPTGHGHYIFKLDLSGEYPAISVSYPNWNYDSHNSTAGTWGQDYFTYVNPLDWKYEGFILPTIDNGLDEGKQIWIGDGEWNNNYSENWWYRWIKLNQYADETVGHGVDGAVGTLHINPFSGSKNYGLRFDPAGYGMKYGSGSGAGDMTDGYLAFTQKANDPGVWNTQAIENIEDYKGKQFYVGLATATEGDYKFSYDYNQECNGLSAIANINDIKVWTEANPDRWSGATVGSLSNTRGHFQIWADNASQKNFSIHWIPDNKMTFDLGDAEGHIAAIDPMYRGRDLSGSEATITLPEPEDWISHTFGGWVINGVQHNAGDEILLNEDMTAVAQWTTNYYTITYTGISAYSTTCDGSTSVLCGTAQTVCTPIEATGYDFSGWTSDVPLGGETEFEGGEPFTMPCENVTFTGSYTPIVYNITYEGLEAGEHTNPATYTIEDEITFTNPTARAGYEFLGWFDAATDGNQVTGIVLGSTGDVTVWAHWNALQYTVKLDRNGGDADGTATFVYNTSNSMNYTAATRNGYDLNGYWTTAGGGTKVLDNSGTVTAGNSAGWKTDGKWTRANNDGTLYAHWTAITGIDYYVYHYKMNVDGTYPETPTAQTSGKGHTDEVKTNLEPNTYEGFVTPAHQDLTIVYGGENILKYYYERNKYALTWAGLEDATVTGDYTQGQVYHGATITYPTSVSKDGYCFMGWDITPTTMPMAATTITAQWAAYENYRTYCGNAVTFVANGGVGEDYVVTTDISYITAPYVTDAGFTRTGYEFIGWTKDGGDGTIIVPNGSTRITGIDGDVTYKALWIGIPTINAAVPVITSTNNVAIASAQRTLTVANPDGLEATIHIAYKKNGETVTATNSEFRFCNTGGTISESNIVSSATSIATDFTIQYKPNAYNKIDSDYTLYITVTRSGSSTVVSSAEFNLKGRSLPEKFVIAVQNSSNEWLALPANMTGACTPAGTPITVTGEGLEMTADASVAAAYSLTGHSFAKDSVFFTSAYNGGNLWAAASSSNDINDNTSTVSSTNRKNFEWGLTPTDETLISYNMANKNNGKQLRYYANSKFGMYASGEDTIYFIAVTPKEETTMVVDEWYKNKILFHLPFAMKSVSMTINGVAVPDDDITIANRLIKTTGYVLYELGGSIDLVAHSGDVMELNIGDGTTDYVATVKIPQIIVGEVDGCGTLPAQSDVVVRDGGHLTIDITNEGVAPKSFNNVTIYPNAKISVPDGKYFRVKSLTFFGGIDEMNGDETNIYAPELSLKGTMKADTIVYRMRVNAEHMMPVSFPYDVTINKIVREDKLDSPSWGKVGTDIRLETYNGELRAAGNRRESDESTWTEIKEGTLTAGIGYTVAAQNRFKNYPYTILDFPMANPYKDAAAEEAVKNAAVQAHDAVNWYDKGWNLMGNPYMAGITGAGAIKVNETGYDFVYIPTADGEDYYQGPIATAKILPFKDFFVQVNEGGTMYFDLTKRVDAPARMLADIERTAQFSIGLTGANKTDITYFKVADNFTESYDIPGDNAKMFGSAVNTKVYSLLNGEDQLAQMALNADMTAQPIPLGYIAPESGEYIFALDNTYTDYQNVEHIYLLENGEIKVDLLNAQYTFATETKTDNERFAILIVMKGAKMPTDLMDGLFDNDVASPKKVIYNDHLYILNTNRRVYDGTGKYINKMQKNK